ncbi:hypothetical protein PUR29_34870 [Methylobacterium ajmalii]|uniref:Uncharacterized protein n=1 Tax=Methylobacterium ajmalii TaxID=2738439 RepID=A0ABV0A577_9HYPH
MSTFHLVALVNDSSKPRKEDGSYHLREQPLSEYGPYDTGAQASKAAKEASQYHGCKVQPRRIADNTDWIKREEERFRQKMYHSSMLLPKEWDLEPIKNHFALVQSHMISYFTDGASGILDRRTTTKVGRYLEQFYPHLGDADKRRLTAVIDPPTELLIARTAEEVVWVYTHGPDSCMAKSTSTWGSSKRHPAEFYGNCDLGVAYLRKGNDRASARAVVWPERKLYGRCYGDIDRLKQKLHEQGYKFTATFVGAKVNPIPHPKYKGSSEAGEWFMVPYFDNIQYVRENPDGTWVTVTSEEVGSLENNGKMFISSGGTGACINRRAYCPRLGGMYQGPFTQVHGAKGHLFWSRDAIGMYAFTCQGSGEVWEANSKNQVKLDNGQMWSKRHFDAHGFTCPGNGKRLPAAEGTRLGDGRLVSREYARKIERMQITRADYDAVVAIQRELEERAISGITLPPVEVPQPEVRATKRKGGTGVFSHLATSTGPALSTSNLRRRSATAPSAGVTIGGVTIGL